jgi:hypothetical protein
MGASSRLQRLVKGHYERAEWEWEVRSSQPLQTDLCGHALRSGVDVGLTLHQRMSAHFH